LATLRQCYSHCGINQVEQITLACSQVLGDHFHVTFVQFSGEIKNKTPREGGHLSSFSRAEDEQSISKRSRFGKVHLNPLVSDVSKLHL
jgi:hypothetical protein